MPFSLRNAAQNFQRFIDTVTRCFVYVDDFLASVSQKEYMKKVLQRLQAHGIQVNKGREAQQVPVGVDEERLTSGAIQNDKSQQVNHRNQMFSRPAKHLFHQQQVVPLLGAEIVHHLVTSKRYVVTDRLQRVQLFDHILHGHVTSGTGQRIRTVLVKVARSRAWLLIAYSVLFDEVDHVIQISLRQVVLANERLRHVMHIVASVVR
ncbi:hypothetical protein T4E_4383 [Trichinella pseudospiralis]|uniref:Reverse transcriptase domain-containing protein n=1 Tax=Trichinella pseudospiralis TaxID=6337 RepID=A0A0V0Y4E2_TRIPS|nr:hypothetical protein T4E_4383 [Trichinella pseudospiralis]